MAQIHLETMAMRYNIICSILLLFILLACSENSPSGKDISFYHWKAKADFLETYRNAIEATSCGKIHLHYFDVIVNQEARWNENKVIPNYVLRTVDKEYRGYDIIPVVYISNAVFKTSDLDINDLSAKIKDLINQISLKQFNKKMKQIQIDCDWTENTNQAYFGLLKELGKGFEINATIRLHQIKYKERTGIPPVKSGTLMLYNIGDLKNLNENSILDDSIVSRYIDPETEYPMKLNVALPIFSQTIAFNNQDDIKIIKGADRNLFEKDQHFRKFSTSNFQVVKDTLYSGFYLSYGFKLKLEELKTSEIIASYKRIKESHLKLNDIIFYHLDGESLSKINLKEIIENL